MMVYVLRDSATRTPIDLGEGEDAQKRLRALISEHGANVTNEDGSVAVANEDAAVSDEVPEAKLKKGK